jgi:hypothetical protein
MTTASPIPAPDTPDVPPPVAAPLEPPNKAHPLLWLVPGGLALLLLVAGVATFAFLAGADDETDVVNVAGYVYTDPQAEDVANWDATMTRTNEENVALLPTRFANTPWATSWSLNDVDRATEGGDSLWLGVIEINPQYASVPDWDAELLINSVARDLCLGDTTLYMESETVAVGWEAGEGWPMIAWFHEGTVSVAAGPDEDAVRAFAEAYITEQNS